MTIALCFSCGDIKFGALVPCQKCGKESRHNSELRIRFSSHFMARSTLEQFGQVIKLINCKTEDENIQFWTFVWYISQNHSDILHAEPPEDLAEPVRSLYEKLDFPTVQRLPGSNSRRGTF